MKSSLNLHHLDRLKDVAATLNTVAKTLPLLRSVAWSDEWRGAFLSRGTLPAPSYERIDMTAAREGLAAARKVLGEGDADEVVTAWLLRLTEKLDVMTALLQTRGTAEFFTHSKTLFGEPTQLMIDRKTRVIDLARHVDDTLDGLDFDKLVIEGFQREFGAEEFAQGLAPLLAEHLGDAAPRIEIVKGLSAKALAGSKRIRVRDGAVFTPRDIDQLLQHEALVHTATTLNGRAQTGFPVLGRAHAGTTEIQEGLAVFAEMISGAMDPRRFRRLSDRVLAAQMSIDGADFKEVFDFYLPRSLDAEAAFENTRRIFRGGVIAGGAPFTKDIVYLNGLLRVHNFMRSVVKLGRADLIRILFTGKMDLEDLPAIAALAGAGELTPPKYMPAWAKDLRFLVSYLAYSGFLNQVKMPGFQSYYEDALKDVPDVWGFVKG